MQQQLLQARQPGNTVACAGSMPTTECSCSMSCLHRQEPAAYRLPPPPPPPLCQQAASSSPPCLQVVAHAAGGNLVSCWMPLTRTACTQALQTSLKPSMAALCFHWPALRPRGSGGNRYSTSATCMCPAIILHASVCTSHMFSCRRRQRSRPHRQTSAAPAGAAAAADRAHMASAGLPARVLPASTSPDAVAMARLVYAIEAAPGHHFPAHPECPGRVEAIQQALQRLEVFAGCADGQVQIALTPAAATAAAAAAAAAVTLEASSAGPLLAARAHKRNQAPLLCR